VIQRLEPSGTVGLPEHLVRIRCPVQTNWPAVRTCFPVSSPELGEERDCSLPCFGLGPPTLMRRVRLERDRIQIKSDIPDGSGPQEVRSIGHLERIGPAAADPRSLMPLRVQSWNQAGPPNDAIPEPRHSHASRDGAKKREGRH
jgi:hypothetical protein